MAARVAEIPGKGRGWVAARPVRGGEVLLTDSPILLYHAASEDDVRNHCAHCFTAIRSRPLALECPCCSHRVFCGPRCSAAAASSSHSAWACRSLSLLRRRAPSLSAEQLLQARFLVAAYNLARVSPAEFECLAGLQGSADAWSDGAARELQSVAGLELVGWGLEVWSGLLAKDRVNAFGLMETAAAETSGEEGGARSVRAYGLYAKASLFNHDCLPNACRFDYLDSGDCNADLIVRAIHDVAEGSEICISYFPVNLDYKTRQARLSADYGFACRCDRCTVEAQWDDDDGDGDDNDDAAEMDDDDDDPIDDDAMSDGDDDAAFPHAYFFGRYMCGRDNCGGTLAPLAPSQQQQPPQSLLTMECNVCGHLTCLQN